MAHLYSDPCVLIGGAPRSGTTLLGQILARHPQGAILLEERLTSVVLAVERLCSIRTENDERERTALFGAPRSFLPCPLWENEADVEKLTALESYAARFKRLFKETFVVSTGKLEARVVGSKLPITDSWEEIDLLRRRLSDLRIIFIVRNPLDVISSSLVRGKNAVEGLDEWPVRDVAAAYEQWLTAMRHMADVIEAEATGDVLMVKYEDLCAFPEREERRIRSFATLPLDDEVVVAHAVANDRPGLSDQDLIFLEHELGDVDRIWPTLTAEQALRRYSRPIRHLPFAEISLGRGAYRSLFASGVSQPEPWGRWTDGPCAVLQFRHPAASRARLGLHVAMAHIPSGGEGAPLTIRVNGGVARPASAKPGAHLYIELDAEHLAEEVVTIQIEVMEPKPPHAAPINDPRSLGIALTGLSLHPILDDQRSKVASALGDVGRASSSQGRRPAIAFDILRGLRSKLPVRGLARKASINLL